MTESAGTRKTLPTSPTCLSVGLLSMVAVTAYPRLLADANGHASHTLAMLLFSAMSIGFVRGVGFRPDNPLLQKIFSLPVCLAFVAAWIAVRLTISR